MLKSLTLSLFIALLSFSAFAQETVIWASEVYEVSSETSPLQYSAMQALGRPNFYPRGGDSPNAWKPRRDNTEEYIVVAFDQPIRAQQVAIAETENPGSIKAVYAYDESDNEYLLFELTPRPLPIDIRLLNLFFEMTSYEINYLRVVLDGEAVPGFNSIDAIGISASNIPITVLINVASNINESAQAERLSDNVNSQYIEHSPLLSPDGKTLYFSRQYHPDNIGGVDDNEDIWFSRLDEETGEWLPAENLGPPLNTEGPNFISAITMDDVGNTVFLLGNRYEKRGRMSVGVSTAIMTPDGDIQAPENLEIENYYNYNINVDQFITSDNEVMLMAVERDDTYGDRDLYVSFKEGKKEWSEPLNVGGTLNTADEEASPFIAQDNETIYFSSRGHSGQGGLDIFVTKRLDDTWTRWSEPENLGGAINGSGDDVYFNIPTSGKHIYFTRGNKDENTDIFRFQVDEFFIEDGDEPMIAEDGEPEPVVISIVGKVINGKTKEPIAADVLVERLPDGAEIGQTVSKEGTGKYHLRLRSGVMYGFLAEKDGFISLNDNIDLTDYTESDTIERDITLMPIQVGERIVINNIFFDFDKSELKTASYPELKRILKFLQEEQIQRIRIGGHTDSKGNDAYNQALSKRRANSVYEYFVNNGISPSRLEAVGYGETDPVVPNDTDENRAKNRRVEFTILE